MALVEVRFGHGDVGSMKFPSGFCYNVPMDNDDRYACMGELAKRVLEIHSFDGRTLTVRYNPAADNQVQDGVRIDENALVQYTESSLTNLLEAGSMFPGLDKIVVDFDSL
ncbi:MAG: hypothetical protein WB644_00010 [Candidatus Cybelea sp.]